MQKLTEYNIALRIVKPKKDVTAKMPVFYNPKMQSNRSISLLMLKTLKKEHPRIALPLAGSGIRALRIKNELEKECEIHINDHKPNFKATFTSTCKNNNIDPKSFHIHNQDANLFLMQSEGFDYIDLDPFGTPNPFLAAAISKISRGGILALTATDTAALTGTYPKVTRRKYWARMQRSPMMHELGLRALIRKIQLQAVQFDKALTPMLAYHKDHYFRIYLKCEKGKTKCDKLLDEHNYFLFNPKTLKYETSKYNKKTNYEYFGPLYTGQILDKKLLTQITKNNSYKEEEKFLALLLEESQSNEVGFLDLHVLARKQKTHAQTMQSALKKYSAVRTHFSPTGIKENKFTQKQIRRK